MAESWTAQDLLLAGWREADLAWETTAERTAEWVAEKDRQQAKDEAGKALQIARAEFQPIDPRLGTSLANYGLCLHLAGHSDGVAPLLREAREVWRLADRWIASMNAPRMARSSLFHMRMEVRTRDIYRARWQVRWREIAEEARTRLEAPIDSNDGDSAVDAEALLHWRRERPAMLNDTRKLMGAAFLLLAKPAPKATSRDGTL